MVGEFINLFSKIFGKLLKIFLFFRYMRKSTLTLLLIFAVVLGIRLFFAFQVEGFLTDESYFHIRQVNHILETGFPLFQEGDRVFVFSPVFDYILAVFGLFFPIVLAGKILSNLFAASLVVAIYLFVKLYTKDEHVALLSALISGFIPIFIGETFASLSVYPLMFSLLLFFLYTYLHLPDNLSWFVITSFFLVFLHPISLVFILGLCVYYVLIYVADIEREKWEFEVVLFSLFLGLWSNFLIYKDALLLYGPRVIWQNIPLGLLSTYFTKITLLEALFFIGLIPFVCGVFIIWKHLFRRKNKYTYMFISYTLVVSLLLWLRLLTPKIGLMLLGLFFVLLFAQFYSAFLDYCTRTRFAKRIGVIKLLIVLVFILTSVFPSVVYSSQVVEESFVAEELASLRWLAKNTPEESVVFALPQEGHLIEAIAKRKTILDSNFLSIADAETRYNDIVTFYTTPSKIQAIEILNRYDVTHVYFSPTARSFFAVEELSFITPLCFVPIYDKEVIIYKSKCEVEQLD